MICACCNSEYEFDICPFANVNKRLENTFVVTETTREDDEENI